MFIVKVRVRVMLMVKVRVRVIIMVMVRVIKGIVLGLGFESNIFFNLM